MNICNDTIDVFIIVSQRQYSDEVAGPAVVACYTGHELAEPGSFLTVGRSCLSRELGIQGSSCYSPPLG
jgi:hypothetical protein